MALREYTDVSGVAWQVWHVVPTTLTTAPPVAPADRRKREEEDLLLERRRRRGMTLTPGMEGGWLCFESLGAKRRLAPVPSDWERCSDARLGDYLSTAIPVARPVERARSEQSADVPRTAHAHPR